jgi:hypothetical protein
MLQTKTDVIIVVCCINVIAGYYVCPSRRSNVKLERISMRLMHNGATNAAGSFSPLGEKVGMRGLRTIDGIETPEPPHPNPHRR